ncbi:hypothetical protein [Actinokineospora sp. HUAS TT18]|uniref:hypothetical protein n=1 Tax=Actinokineospora sp. HUAS TT18 TaxID=3447451 RepID=UPI003F51AEFB
MDERKISELFRDAVRDVPPASFNQEDVAAESTRLTRKRNSLVAGSALGFVLLAGGIVAGVALWPGSETGRETGAAAGAPFATSNDSRSSSETVNDSGQGVAEAEPELPPTTPAGGLSNGKAGVTTGGAPSGCGSADRELAAALAGELPAATSAADTVNSPLACPTGARSAAFGVQDGPRRGFMSIMIVPQNTAQMLQPPWADRPSGTEGAVVATKSGKSLVVVVEPLATSAAPPVSADQVRGIADKLATRY